MNDNSVTTAVVSMRKRFDDTVAHLVENGQHVMIANDQAATEALRDLPILNSKANVAKYIACIAWMQSRQLLTAAESKAHLYTAQLALAAFDSGKPETGKVVKVAGIKRQHKAVR